MVKLKQNHKRHAPVKAKHQEDVVRENQKEVEVEEPKEEVQAVPEHPLLTKVNVLSEKMDRILGKNHEFTSEIQDIKNDLSGK